MRYLHPVQKHEAFAASGRYRFFKNGRTLRKSEAWAAHALPDGETMIRIDVDSRLEDGKSILFEALQNPASELVRFDVRYDSAYFEHGVKTLRATCSLAEDRLQIGYVLNGAARDYLEIELPPDALIDVPLLFLRGRILVKMAAARRPLPLFVPMFEHVQLFPGLVRTVHPPVEYVADDLISLGRRQIETRRYRYLDQAASYWIDRHGVIIKRVKAFKQQEFVVLISNYAQRPQPTVSIND